jgi:type III restriction enzyme
MMSPLCTLRYSATHAEKHHMVFRLDAVDAYERKLVKQIEVAAAGVEGDHNKPYARLVSAANKRGSITAKVELDVQRGNRVSREEKTVQDGEDLQQITGRAVYGNCSIGEIQCGKGKELIEVKVPGGERWLRVGESMGGVDDEAMKRQMIRRTIKEHLDKELRLAPLGIKVLSLFFIDSVKRYRMYDEEGNPQKGAGTRRSSRMNIGDWQGIRTTKACSRRSMSAPPRPRCTTATSRSIRKAPGQTPPRPTRATETTPSVPTT